MKLVTSLTSPYGRKARAVAIECGHDDLEIVEDAVMEESARAPQWNPLGKVPILLLDDGTILYDSPVICEFLDQHERAPTLLPPFDAERFAALRDQALGDGLIDAAFLIVIERRRPEAQQSDYWIARWTRAIVRALDAMEAGVDGRGEELDLGAIAWGCALGYLDFRHADLAWRDGRPKLAAWAEALHRRESFTRTRPPA